MAGSREYEPSHVPSLPVDDPIPTADVRLTSRSPLIPIVVATSLLVLPPASVYLLLRRSLVSLHRKLDDVTTLSASFQRQLNRQTEFLNVTAKREDHLRSRLEESLREIAKLRQRADLGAEARVAHERPIREQLAHLRVERQHDRERLAVFRELGISLADIAAFMHEVDIRQGFWTQRTDNGEIEHIRQIALKLQSIPLDQAAEGPAEKTSDNQHAS